MLSILLQSSHKHSHSSETENIEVEETVSHNAGEEGAKKNEDHNTKQVHHDKVLYELLM